MEFIISFRIIALVFLASVCFYTLFLIRVGKLSATLSVSWLMTEIFLFLLIAIKPIGDLAARLIGKQNLNSVVSFFIVGWIILLMLNTLTRVSDLTNKIKSVIQENAILRQKIDSLEKRINTNSRSSENTKKDL